MYRITKTDGRVHFFGMKFLTDSLETDDIKAVNKARELGYTVEKVEKAKVVEVVEDPIAPPAEEKFVCEICGQEAKTNAGLSAHMRAKHD